MGEIRASRVPWGKDNPLDCYSSWGRADSAGWVFAGTDVSTPDSWGCGVVRFDSRAPGGISEPENFALESDCCQGLTVDPLGESSFTMLSSVEPLVFSTASTIATQGKD